MENTNEFIKSFNKRSLWWSKKTVMAIIKFLGFAIETRPISNKNDLKR